ncbi:MAG: hypothetical protein KatS3mg053_2630 [Candidatus Roseilinea sp.]|nr:MAG: hypothetical protein KatS3mg053_2630 [Candidatus Roseilinea sp.]
MAIPILSIRVRKSGDAVFALPYCAYRPSFVMR